MKPHRILMPQDIDVHFCAEETGSSYLENAMIKARTLFDVAGGMPVIADDSGLSVPALGGSPGIYSARYGIKEMGRALDATERNAFLLENMRDFKKEQRRALFVCCMVLVLDTFRIFSAQESFSGYIADRASGDGGFGYDPVFYVPETGCVLAELNAKQKDAISHRGRAAGKIKAIIDCLDRE